MAGFIKSFVDFIKNFNIQEIIEEIKAQPLWILVIVLWIAVITGLVLGFYKLLEYLKKYSVVRSLFNRFYIATAGSERRRLLDEYKTAIEYGTLDKISWISKLDRLVLGSGIKKISRFLTTEAVIFGTLSLSMVVFIIVTMTVKMWNLALLCSFLVAFTVYFILRVLNRFMYKRIENELIAFTNITDNFSRASDDLVDILDRSSWYVNEPLKSALRDCVSYIRFSGDKELAIERLKMTIQHQKFRDLIRNLDIASRYEANYSEIIADNRKMLSDYLRDKKEREAIYANGRLEIFVVLVICVFAMMLVSDLTSTGLRSLIFGSAFGVGLVIYLVLVTVYAIKTLFFDDNRIE